MKGAAWAVSMLLLLDMGRSNAQNACSIDITNFPDVAAQLLADKAELFATSADVSEQGTKKTADEADATQSKARDAYYANQTPDNLEALNKANTADQNAHAVLTITADLAASADARSVDAQKWADKAGSDTDLSDARTDANKVLADANSGQQMAYNASVEDVPQDPNSSCSDGANSPQPIATC